MAETVKLIQRRPVGLFDLDLDLISVAADCADGVELKGYLLPGQRFPSSGPWRSHGWA